MPVYRDYKTGQSVGDVQDNLQIRHLVTSHALANGLDVCLGEVCYLREDGSHWIDGAEFSALHFVQTIRDLVALRAGVYKAHEDVEAGRQPKIAAGDWCKYCGAYMACPRKIALVRALADKVADVGRLELVGPEALARAWQEWREIREVYERVDEQIKAAVLERGMAVPLRPGAEVRIYERSRTFWQGEVVESVFAKYGVTEEDRRSCMRVSAWREAKEVKVRK
jgi:hypothetical protein